MIQIKELYKYSNTFFKKMLTAQSMSISDPVPSKCKGMLGLAYILYFNV